MRRRAPEAGADRRIETLPWARVVQAPHRLLALDYDGTLTPFRVRRDEAVPHAGSMRAIERIAIGGGTTVAVISGRPIADLERIPGPIPVHLAGEHGREVRASGATTLRHPLPARVAGALKRACRAAMERGWGGHLERKRVAIVLHTRARLATPEAVVGFLERWIEAVRSAPARTGAAR